MNEAEVRLLRDSILEEARLTAALGLNDSDDAAQALAAVTALCIVLGENPCDSYASSSGIVGTTPSTVPA